MYTWVGKHLASWGFACALYSVPQPFAGFSDAESWIEDAEQWVEGIRRSIDLLLSADLALDGLQGHCDPGAIAALGHSTGAAAALIAAGRDPRIRAAVAFAAGDSTAVAMTFAIPVQLQAASLDKPCPPADNLKTYGQLPLPKQYVEIAGGNHLGYLDDGIWYRAGSAFVDDYPATIERAEQERLAKKYMTSWLLYHLREDRAFESVLFGSESAADKASGVLSALEFAR